MELEIFRNTIELLLGDCVDDQLLTDMLENFGGESWSNPDVQGSLRRKLQTSYKVYLELVQSMNNTLKEFKDRLKLDENGKVRAGTSPSTFCESRH